MEEKLELHTPIEQKHSIMNTQRKKWALLILFLLTQVYNYAQVQIDTSLNEEKVIVTMTNGEVFRGIVKRQTTKELVITIENGELSLTRDKIKKVEKDYYLGVFRFTNPHDTRYFFGPTGIPIKPGKGYYQNLMVTTNFVNVGIIKNFSIGGGFEFISTVMGEPIWFLTPKFGFKVADNLHVGGGVFMLGSTEIGLATLAYGVVTYGGSDSNISLGAGYGLYDGQWADYPAIMLSGSHRLTNIVSLLSENYYIISTDENVYIGVQGIRILSKKNAFDLGIILSSQFDQELPALPYVGYARAF